MRIVLGLCGVLVAAQAGAQQVQVRAGGCGSPVHVIARDAPLSKVLAELARVLEFKLQFDADSDPLVSVDASRRPVELVTTLAPEMNVGVTQSRDPGCAGRDRISKVWVLPKGQAKPGRERRAAVPPIEYRPQGPGTYDGADRAHDPDAR
jgi:hypothetical protein